MLKFLTHKLRTHSLNEESIPEKVDGHDSGTESDDEIDSPESMRASPAESACGPPYALAEPSPVDAQYDHHSSEEELEVINSMESAMSGCAAAAPEKRTWSQAAAAPTPPSSDEEVGAPVRFRTEPPLEARRPRHRAPSPHRLAPHAHYEASPRKRSRHLTRRQRPCLDFDKMQQLKVRAVWRHHSGDHGGELSVFCW